MATIRDINASFKEKQVETIKELLLRIETLEKKVSELMGV